MNRIKYTKELLFERMKYIDPKFKINESINEDNNENNDFLPITTPIGSNDDKLFVGIVNQGIDSYLEGFTKSKFEVKDTSLGKKRVFNFHKSELPVLLRRLEEIGTEEAIQWKEDIENHKSEDIDETLKSNQNNETKNRSINPNIDEALEGEAHNAFSDIIAFIRNRVKTLNDDEVYELHEELKAWFQKWI